MHSAEKFTKYQSVPLPEMSLLVQPFKFGTIGFFLISGFLIGDRLPTSDPLGYLRRRANRLVPAWALWCVLWTLYFLQRDLPHSPGAALSLGLFSSTLYAASIRCLVETPLWFIPNLLVAITCLVLLRRWLNDLRLGAALLALSLFYGVNVYARWLPSRHTEALFGFVFYLWLGAWCALRKERIQSWAAACSPWRLSFWAFLAAAVSLVEMKVLTAHANPDSFNSLRFGNQIYSVLIVILLMRIRRRTWPAFINVAQTTYGIYLIHAMTISVAFAAAMSLIHVRGYALGPWGILLMWVILAPTAYAISLQLTRLFASSPRWAWAVGVTSVGTHESLPNSAARSEPTTQAEQGLSNA